MRRLLILAIFLSLSFFGQAGSESQSPPQKTIPPIAEHSKNSAHSKDKPNDPQYSPVNFSSVSNVSAGGKLDINAPQTKNSTDAISFKWTDELFTALLLVLVTAGLVWVGWYQLRTTRTTTRAYVRISSCSPGIVFIKQPIGPPHLACNLEIKNYGETPAHITDIVIQAKIVEAGQLLPDIANFEGAKRYPCSNAFLVRGEGIFYHFFDETLLTEALIVDIKEGNKILCLYGYVDYIDAFDKRHRGGFGQNYYQAYDRRENYPSDEAFTARNNLTFLMQAGYNYDRQRKDGQDRD